MIDMETARQTVEARQAEAQAALVNEEAAQQEHRRMMAATGAAMIESQTRIKQEKVARHAELRAVARHRMDHHAELVAVREQCEMVLGRSRADLEAAQRNANRCTPPDPDTPRPRGSPPGSAPSKPSLTAPSLPSGKPRPFSNGRERRRWTRESSLRLSRYPPYRLALVPPVSLVAKGGDLRIPPPLLSLLSERGFFGRKPFLRGCRCEHPSA